MLETLISSKTRVKLLMKFFLNSNNTAYLRSLEGEFGESTNAIRIELNKMEDAGMLTSFLDGNKKMYRANTGFPLYEEINSIIRKTIGLDTVVQAVVERLGDVDKVFLTGDFSRGLDSSIIDLVFVGNIDKSYLLELIEKTERIVNRKIRFLVLEHSELDNQLNDNKGWYNQALLLWSK